MERKRGPLALLVTHAVLVLLVMIILMPVVWVALASFQKGGNLYGMAGGALTTENYRTLLGTSRFMLWVRNSLRGSRGSWPAR